MSNIPFGKKIKSTVDQTLFKRFPKSESVQTLPAGKPSPIIESYLQSGYYQLAGENEFLYLKKDDETQQIIEPGGTDDVDQAGAFAGVTSWLADSIFNTSRKATKQAGFLADGFKESVSDLGTDFSILGKNLTKALVISIPVFAAILAFWIISKLD